MSEKIPPKFLLAYTRPPGSLNPGVAPRAEDFYQALATLTRWVKQLDDAGAFRALDAKAEAPSKADKPARTAKAAKPVKADKADKADKGVKPTKVKKVAKASKAAKA